MTQSPEDTAVALSGLYRKKPIALHAELWKPGVEDAWMFLWAQKGTLSDEFASREAGEAKIQRWVDAGEVGRDELLPIVVPVIKTLEGPHRIGNGDWIITGVKGERYPCKPDIFAATYEPASRAALTQPVPGGAVKVKPLTFEKQNVDGTFWCSEGSVTGMYRVRFVREQWVTMRNDIIVGRSETSADGIAAAQAHHEARILSAIAPAPQEVGDMVLVPINPDYKHLARLSTLWGYTIEETADSYAAFLEALPAALTTQVPNPSPFDMLSHLARQRKWSEATFGPGLRTKGVIDHIRKELAEIEADPSDIAEWIDVTILALDGAWRAGHSPEQIVDALVAKQTKNEGRDWPDWRTMSPDQAIEHVRSQS